MSEQQRDDEPTPQRPEGEKVSPDRRKGADSGRDELEARQGAKRHGRQADEPDIEDFDVGWPEDLDVLHCYRHPDRETGVSCSNCGRPICYECMTPAPVGFRCPECMGEQRSLRPIAGARRTPRSRARVISREETRARWQGGLAGARSNQVTRVLVGLNVLMFILQSVSNQVLVEGILWPERVIGAGEYWRLLTAMFLHGGLLHLLFNMWALYVAGSYLEVLAGRAKYLAIYLVSGLSGNVLVLLLSDRPTVGASTAIYGVFGALFIYSLRHRNTLAGMALRSMGFVIAINLVITFTYSGISWQGHIGGLVGGIIAVEALSVGGRKDLRAPVGGADLFAMLAFVGMLVVAIVWRAQSF